MALRSAAASASVARQPKFSMEKVVISPARIPESDARTVDYSSECSMDSGCEAKVRGATSVDAQGA
jgi:hypothetical protein